MSKLRKDFGQRIKQLRKTKGLTQEKLAEKAHLEPTYLGSVERGERNLTIDNIEKIAKGFRLEPFHFFMFHLDAVADESTVNQQKVLTLIKSLPAKKKKRILQIMQICAQLGD